MITPWRIAIAFALLTAPAALTRDEAIFDYIESRKRGDYISSAEIALQRRRQRSIKLYSPWPVWNEQSETEYQRGIERPENMRKDDVLRQDLYDRMFDAGDDDAVSALFHGQVHPRWRDAYSQLGG